MMPILRNLSTAFEMSKKTVQQPGAEADLQGYLAAVRGDKRVPPSWHPAHTDEFKAAWLVGYDEFKASANSRLKSAVRKSSVGGEQ